MAVKGLRARTGVGACLSERKQRNGGGTEERQREAPNPNNKKQSPTHPCQAQRCAAVAAASKVAATQALGHVAALQVCVGGTAAAALLFNCFCDGIVQ